MPSFVVTPAATMVVIDIRTNDGCAIKHGDQNGRRRQEQIHWWYVKPDVCHKTNGPRGEAATPLEKKRDQKEEDKKLEKNHQRQHLTQVGQLACVQITYISFEKGL
jgi:hypothetical protein